MKFSTAHVRDMSSDGLSSSMKENIVFAALVIVAVGFAVFMLSGGLSSNVNVTLDGDDGISEMSGEGTYNEGSNVTVSAVVYLGWVFDGWFDSSGNEISTNQSVTVHVTSDCTLHAKTHRGYGVELYHAYGVESVSGRSSYELDEDATITATVSTGTLFKGWYDLSGSLVYRGSTIVLRDHTDVTLVAVSTKSNPYIDDGCEATTFTGNQSLISSEDVVLLDFVTGDYVASDVGTTTLSVHVVPGAYKLVSKGYDASDKWRKDSEKEYVDGIAPLKYTWRYNNVSYSLTWNVQASTYQKYSSYNTSSRAPQSDSARLSFVTYDSDALKDVANELAELSGNMTENQRADFVLKFVQLCTTYQLDSDYNGQSEYWKYPVETLFERKGDCEDTSVLYATLMKAMGYEDALILFSGAEYIDRGHAAALVALESVPGGTYYVVDGQKYYYCETTSDTMNVGDPAEGYDKGYIIVVK